MQQLGSLSELLETSHSCQHYYDENPSSFEFEYNQAKAGHVRVIVKEEICSHWVIEAKPSPLVKMKYLRVILVLSNCTWGKKYSNWPKHWTLCINMVPS